MAEEFLYHNEKFRYHKEKFLYHRVTTLLTWSLQSSFITARLSRVCSQGGKEQQGVRHPYYF